MVNVGCIVEGQSEAIVYKSSAFKSLLERLNLNLVKTVTPGGRYKFFNREQIIKYCNEMFDDGVEKIIMIIDKETNDECLSDIKKGIYNCDPQNQIIIIQVKTLESWFLADSEALSKAFQEKYNFEDNPEKVEGDPFSILQNLFIEKTGKGLGPKDSTLPAQKMVYKFGFSLQNAANHPNCPSAKYFLQKLALLNPNS